MAASILSPLDYNISIPSLLDYGNQLSKGGCSSRHNVMCANDFYIYIREENHFRI